jgi:hypothetical protein
MAQTVIRLPLNAEPGFEPGSLHVGFVQDKVALGQGFSQITSKFSCQCHSTIAPSSSEYCPYQEDKRTKAWELSNKAILCRKQDGGALDEKVLSHSYIRTSQS